MHDPRRTAERPAYPSRMADHEAPTRVFSFPPSPGDEAEPVTRFEGGHARPDPVRFESAPDSVTRYAARPSHASLGPKEALAPLGGERMPSVHPHAAVSNRDVWGQPPRFAPEQAFRSPMPSVHPHDSSVDTPWTHATLSTTHAPAVGGAGKNALGTTTPVGASTAARGAVIT